jgi:hypothetical protein
VSAWDLGRSKQCRERWYNNLDPNIKRGDYSLLEDRTILAAQARLGNKWSQIALLLPGRTEDHVKIRYKDRTQISQDSYKMLARYDSLTALSNGSITAL